MKQNFNIFLKHKKGYCCLQNAVDLPYLLQAEIDENAGVGDRLRFVFQIEHVLFLELMLIYFYRFISSGRAASVLPFYTDNSLDPSLYRIVINFRFKFEDY